MKLPVKKPHCFTWRSLFILLIPLLLLALYLAFGRAYLLCEISDNVSAVWHDDEAFIFVSKITAGINEKVWRVEAAGFFNPWGIGGLAEKFREDLVVFHLSGDKLEQYYLKNFGHGGWGFPFEGTLYIYGSGDTMRWNGTNFIRISKSEDLKITNQFPPLGSVEHSMEEQFKKEGWQEYTSMGFLSNNGPYPIKLHSRSFTIVLREDEAYSPQWVILEGRLGSDSKETLFFNDKCHFRWVTKRAFFKAKEKQN